MSYHRIFDGMEVNGYEIDTSKLAETGSVFINGEVWCADELITEEDKLKIFDEDLLRSKEDILSNIDILLKEITDKNHRDNKHSEKYYDRYIKLVNRFKSRVEKSLFPQKLEDWWHYQYEVRETGITLYLEHVSSIDLNEEGFISIMYTDTSFNLIHVASNMLTVDQYAQANDVTTTTVRQWIRRGKIRTAVKQGSEWRIPELAEIKDRGYTFAQYEWEEYLTGFPEEYEFINDYSKVSISQNKDLKDTFDILFNGNNANKSIQLNNKEKEKLELLLVSNPYVTPSNATITNRF